MQEASRARGNNRGQQALKLPGPGRARDRRPYEGRSASADVRSRDRASPQRAAAGRRDISRFSPRIDRIFSGEALNPFLVLKMKDFRNFVLHNCILVFDAEQVYLKLQVMNLKNKEVTVNPKPQP